MVDIESCAACRRTDGPRSPSGIGARTLCAHRAMRRQVDPESGLREMIAWWLFERGGRRRAAGMWVQDGRGCGKRSAFGASVTAVPGPASSPPAARSSAGRCVTRWPQHDRTVRCVAATCLSWHCHHKGRGGSPSPDRHCDERRLPASWPGGQGAELEPGPQRCDGQPPADQRDATTMAPFARAGSAAGGGAPSAIALPVCPSLRGALFETVVPRIRVVVAAPGLPP